MRALAGIVIVATAALLGVGGCVTAGGPPRPTISPTGVEFEPGIPPGQTRFSQVAMVYISQGHAERAVEQALQGIEINPYNPIHFYLAGLAYTRMGMFVEADTMFERAQQIYPAYAMEIEPERERAWAESFNEGLESHVTGDVEGTVEAWRRATQIYDLRAEAHRNLGTLLAELGDYDEAINVFREGLVGLDRSPVSRFFSPEEESARAQARISMTESVTELLLLKERFDEAEPLLRASLEHAPDNIDVKTRLATALAGQGRSEEAAQIYADVLSGPTLTAADLFKVGVALFRLQEYDRASESFRMLTELQPESRDAWFNYANSLFASQTWDLLAPAAKRLVELDPLSENAALIAARASLESGDQQTALQIMESIDAKPIHLADLQLRPSVAETRVEGQIVGNAADAGSDIRVRFTFFDDNGAIGTQDLVLEAPPPGISSSFEVVFPNRASAYRYQVLPAATSAVTP